MYNFFLIWQQDAKQPQTSACEKNGIIRFCCSERCFTSCYHCSVPEHYGEEDDTAKVYGEPTEAGSVCYTTSRGSVCGKLGGWMGFH